MGIKTGETLAKWVTRWKSINEVICVKNVKVRDKSRNSLFLVWVIGFGLEIQRVQTFYILLLLLLSVEAFRCRQKQRLPHNEYSIHPPNHSTTSWFFLILFQLYITLFSCCATFYRAISPMVSLPAAMRNFLDQYIYSEIYISHNFIAITQTNYLEVPWKHMGYLLAFLGWVSASI